MTRRLNKKADRGGGRDKTNRTIGDGRKKERPEMGLISGARRVNRTGGEKKS